MRNDPASLMVTSKVKMESDTSNAKGVKERTKIHLNAVNDLPNRR